MRKLHKTSFIVLTILSLVFFAGWLALTFFIVPPASLGLGRIGCKMFADPDFWKGFINFSRPEAISFNATAYFVLACAIVLLFVSIFGIRKKPCGKVFGIVGAVLLILVDLFSLNILSASYFHELSYAMGQGTFSTMQNFGIMYFVWLGLALLFLCFYFAAVIDGVKYSKRSRLALAAASEQTEEAPLTEEIPANEFEQYEAEPVPVFIPEPNAEMEPTPVSAVVEAAPEVAPAVEKVEETPVAEPATFTEAPVEEPVVEEKKAEPTPALDPKDLAMLIRDIVRDELARSNDKTVPSNDSHTDNHSIVGATFAGPLVVQYFGTSPVPGAAPQVVATPAPIEAAPAPVVEEKKEEPKPATPFVKKEAPVVEPAKEEPKVEEVKPEEPKAPIVRISFMERMLEADPDMKKNYNTIKNEILAYGVHSRVSNSGDTFRLHRKTFIKLTVAGKSLKLYFALDPADYADSKIPVIDASNKAAYAEIPLVFKVRSDLSVRRCIQLIADVMARDGLEKGEVLSVDWVKELKFLLKEAEKNKKSLDDED